MQDKNLKTTIIGLFLLSHSVFYFELILTRIFSVILSYHYVFLVISIALLGLGLGGVAFHLLLTTKAIPRIRFNLILMSFPLAIPLSFFFLLRLSFLPASHSSVLIYALIIFWPFFLAGPIFAGIFYYHSRQISKLYGADLIGAAIGTISVLFLLKLWGGEISVFFSGVSSAAAVFLLSLRKERDDVPKQRAFSLGAGLVLIINFGVFALFLSNPKAVKLPLGQNPDKQSYVVLKKDSPLGEVIETRWSSFGRTDLVKLSKLPEIMIVYLDGTAGSPMLYFEGHLEKINPVVKNLIINTPGFFPFFFLSENEKDTLLSIGPGGGRDVLLALWGKVKQIEAVEVNPDIVSLTQKYSWFNGGIFSSFNNVRLKIAEGRNYLKRQKQLYDLIMFNFPYTKSSRSWEGFMLTENFLFTKEAVNDYLNHLTPEGRLIISCDQEIEMMRLVTTAVEVFKEKGLDEKEALSRIYVLGSLNKKNLFVLKKTPFAVEEIVKRGLNVEKFGFKYHLSFLPYVELPLKEELMKLARGEITLAALEREYKQRGFNIAPVSDNRPYFYNFKVGLPSQVSLLFRIALTLVILAIIGPLVYLRIINHTNKSLPEFRKKKISPSWRYLIVFIMLGLGFMLIEISLIQRFILFLGQPGLSVNIILFGLIVGSGMGSLTIGRVISLRIRQSIFIFSLSVCGIGVIYHFLLPFLFNYFMGSEYIFRISLAALLGGILGFFMGMLFPLWIRELEMAKKGDCIPWMYGLNAVSSVLGSILTMIISLWLGFREAFLVGIFCYLIILILAYKPQTQG